MFDFEARAFRARFSQRSTLAGLLIAGAFLAGGCTAERERIGSVPSEPAPPPDVSGSYEASSIIVEREGRFTELIGEPDTRISLTLNADGSAQGQLKIGTDPELRTKQTLVGTWRVGFPSFVSFDFSEPSMLEETTFTIVHDGLVGEWLGLDVRARIELRKID